MISEASKPSNVSSFSAQPGRGIYSCRGFQFCTNHPEKAGKGQASTKIPGGQPSVGALSLHPGKWRLNTGELERCQTLPCCILPVNPIISFRWPLSLALKPQVPGANMPICSACDTARARGRRLHPVHLADTHCRTLFLRYPYASTAASPMTTSGHPFSLDTR